MFEGVSCIPFPGGSERDHSRRPTSGIPRARYPFYLGPESRLVETAVRDLFVAPPSSREYYPRILFYGPPGTGKSHLIWGISRAIKKQKGRNFRLIQTTGIDFARELIDAIDTRSTDEFRARFRQADLVLVDDLLQVESKETAQQELITLLDHLSERGGRFVSTAPSPPGDWIQILPGLQSRLTDGLLVPLPLPEPGVRAMILANEAHHRGLSIELPVVQLLAEAIPGTARDLTGAINELAMMARLEASPIDLVLAGRFLSAKTGKGKISILDIAKAAASVFGVSVQQLRSSSRHRQVVTARGVAIYLARLRLGDSFETIGRFFGGRDHTTIMHGYRKTESALKTDLDLKEVLERTRQVLNGNLPKTGSNQTRKKRRGPYR